MGEFFKFITTIWQDNWRDRMFFIIGIVLVSFGCFSTFNQLIFKDLDNGYKILALFSGLIILFFVAKDWSKKNQEKKRTMKVLKDATKIINFLGGHIIINDKREWIIKFIDGSFQLFFSICIKCRIPLYYNQKPPDWEWYCDQCNDKFNGKSPETEKQIALVKLNDEIDRAKKELGIDESYRIKF